MKQKYRNLFHFSMKTELDKENRRLGGLLEGEGRID